MNNTESIENNPYKITKSSPLLKLKIQKKKKNSHTNLSLGIYKLKKKTYCNCSIMKKFIK